MGGQSSEMIFPLNYNLNLGESFLLKALSLLSPSRNRVIVIGSPYFSGYLVRAILVGYWKMYGEFPEVKLVSDNEYLKGITSKEKKEYLKRISKENDDTKYLELGAFVRVSEYSKVGTGGAMRVEFKPVPDYSFPHMRDLVQDERNNSVDKRGLFILIGDPNKLTESYSIMSNLLYAMSMEGVVAPVITEIVDKAGLRMILELERLLSASKWSGPEIPSFFLGVDPYQEPVKPMLAVLDAINPDFPRGKICITCRSA